MLIQFLQLVANFILLRLPLFVSSFELLKLSECPPGILCPADSTICAGKLVGGSFRHLASALVVKALILSTPLVAYFLKVRNRILVPTQLHQSQAQIEIRRRRMAISFHHLLQQRHAGLWVLLIFNCDLAQVIEGHQIVRTQAQLLLIGLLCFAEFTDLDRKSVV